MGYGPVSKGKQTPITPYKGSWAWELEQRQSKPKPAKQSQWPMGYPTTLTKKTWHA